MRGIVTSADVFEKGKLPQTEKEWLNLADIHEKYVDVEGLAVNYAVFGSKQANSADKITIYAGGTPRDSTRREKLPLVNKLFGYIASGMAMQSTIGVNFNWPGQGRSEGDILSSSIDSRALLLAQLSEKLADIFDVGRIDLVAASMGAYCATLAAQQIDSSRLGKVAFLSPAAYPESAHSLTYKNGFSAEISKPWEVSESPIYSILAELHVPTLVAYSEFDDPPIPKVIQSEFKNLSDIEPSVEFHTIVGVSHNFRRPGLDHTGNVVDNNAVRSFGHKVVSFLETTKL